MGIVFGKVQLYGLFVIVDDWRNGVIEVIFFQREFC